MMWECLINLPIMQLPVLPEPARLGNPDHPGRVGLGKGVSFFFFFFESFISLITCDGVYSRSCKCDFIRIIRTIFEDS